MYSCWLSAANGSKGFDDDETVGYSLRLAAWHIENVVSIVVVVPAPFWWIEYNLIHGEPPYIEIVVPVNDEFHESLARSWCALTL